MAGEYQTNRVVVICGGQKRVPAALFADVLALANDEAWRIQERDLRMALTESGIDNPRLREDTQRWMRRVSGFALQIETVENGSIVAELALGALALWVLDKTLGETLTEAWKDSARHERLKEFLLGRGKQNAVDLASAIETRINSGKTTVPLACHVTTQETATGTETRVAVSLSPNAPQIPTIEEVAREESPKPTPRDEPGMGP